MNDLETSAIDALFLELSQFTRATTPRELAQANALKAALETNERLEIVIHAIRRMAESGCELKCIIDACEAEFPEPVPRNREWRNNNA